MPEKEYTINIIDSERITVQEDNSEIMSVQFEIMKGEESQITLRHGYPLDVEEDEVLADLETVLNSYIRDIDLGTKNAAKDSAYAKADETMIAIKGKKIIRKK